MTETDLLIRRLIGRDPGAAARIVDRARTSDEPILLVAAALLDPTAPELLAQATALASSTRDRQLTAIAATDPEGTLS